MTKICVLLDLKIFLTQTYKQTFLFKIKNLKKIYKKYNKS